ncbi:MAG: urea ABC transporter ATP-binding protein UrtD [Spongiibacteraceae bacterium]|jgi:urea transport system ATP-binding protein|nr:urea ABC transporter ATP-binding protein UrtD [Spongiibacteraceae bacterium]
MKAPALLEEFRQRDRLWPQLIQNPTFNPDVSHRVILYVEDLTVSFDGFKALNNLNLYVDDGELRCLIGANGAGKTTLMDVITGKTPCDYGTAYFGQTINLLEQDEAEIAQLGIGRKFQKPSVFEALTVHENLELALKTHKDIWHSLRATLTSSQQDRIYEVLKTINLSNLRHRDAASLSHGQKQWLEIGMLLVAEPRLLLIDEPVAGMTASEADRTAELLTSLAGKHTVIVVEHDMEFVRKIARTVSVLHQGSLLAEGTMDEIQNNEDVIEVYLGEDAGAFGSAAGSGGNG